MPKHSRMHQVSSRDGTGGRGAKSTSTGDLPPIQVVIHADPQSFCKCCSNNDQQDIDEFCRRCCGTGTNAPVATSQNQEQMRRRSSSRPGDTQTKNYPELEDFSMQTDECQTHFHKHLYNASLLQKYCGGNIFGPRNMDQDDEAVSADEIVVEEATDATQTNEDDFPKVKLVRLMSDAETQTTESILSQLKSSNPSHHTMKHVNTSLTMIRCQNPFLYNFNESESIDELLQPYCQCQSAPTSRHASTPPPNTETHQSLSNIYQLPPEEKPKRKDSQTFMGCFKRKRSKDRTKQA
ncbi:uncharacterized protein LOC120348871 [Nilaparvata lugens]|uniref:uncharacterized protein LOC120348871 n=1 Tax=Nilaparvata lugens TaxID=108931 RepID=UPI00193EA8C1|nr:uncharacterized protein LOC120348871 [Nilaparvata lugens]